MSGGGRREVPKYNNPKNSPFMTKEEKKITTDRIKEQKPPPVKEKNPLVNLQVYEPQKQFKKKEPTINPSMYMPMNTNNPYIPPQFQMPWMYNYSSSMPKIPIVKNYNINVSGPTTDHGRVNMIFEDILPMKEFNSTLNTVEERKNIQDYIRAVLLKNNDGENIELDGSKDTLMSYIKFMELNPYNVTSIHNNPYKSLPDNMLIYRSCYPIRYDNNSGMVQCAKNSIGVNVRIYKLTIEEYNIRKNNRAKYSEFDVWRELAYYEYIREQIIKKHVSPNFAMLYLYYICENTNIDFDKIMKMKGKIVKPQNLYTQIQTQQQTQQQTTQQIQQPPFMQQNTIYKINEKAYNKKSLICLTEAPNNNIYMWASKIYKNEGNIKKMVNTGYHDKKVWKSILFQLISGLYVLQINNIAFEDFKLENNVFIKEINAHGNIRKHWKYIIDGYEYYIPNYGYLLLIDSNYADIEQNISTFVNNPNRKYKIYGNMYGNNNNTYIKKKSFEALKKCINPNNFSNNMLQKGVVNPPDEILFLMNKMYTEINNDKNQDIGYYIKKYMTDFLNNRIGTYLRENEISSIIDVNKTNIKEGELVPYEVQYNTYKFGIYAGETKENGKIKLITKENDKIIEKSIGKGLIREYTNIENVAQEFNPDESNLNEKELLEIYTINKN